MRVLFVYPDIEGVEHYGARKFYHGLGYLSSVLKAGGHQTELFYLERLPSRGEFLGQVEAIQPDLVAFSSTTHQHPYVEETASWIKDAWPRLLVISGGTHPTLAPERVIAHPAIDAVCIGEGEETLLELVERLEQGRSYHDVAGLWVRHNGDVVRNSLRPLIKELDTLPFADRELFDTKTILATNEGWLDMMSGRGCPYNCSYCCNPGLKARYRGLGPYVRFRSVSHVLSEIREVAARYRFQIINFQDDTFTLHKPWTLEFCQTYGAEFHFPFWINTRVERLLDEEIVAALAAAGCRGVRVGIESGNEHLRRDILKRKMSNQEIKEAFRLAQRYGLQTYSCNMLGIPGETPEMIQETINLNREIGPTDLQFSVFFPYPMTELYDISVREGYYQEGQTLPSYYGSRSVLNLPTLSPEELEAGYQAFANLKAELRMKRARSRTQKYRPVRMLVRMYQRGLAWLAQFMGKKPESDREKSV